MYVCMYSTCSAVVKILERPGASPGASLVRRSLKVVLSCVIRLSTNTFHLHVVYCIIHVRGVARIKS